MEYDGKKMRHELKFYINYYDYISLKNKIGKIMAQDEFATSQGSYHIRSLYFDDLYNSALYEKNFGVFRRKKYRIRIYNKSDKVIKLEKKSKLEQYICKETAPLTLNEYEKVMFGDVGFMISSPYEVHRDFYIQFNNNVLRPKVIVDYEREAYVLKTGDMRITFDMKLQYGLNSNNIFDPDLVTINALDESTMILEVKYNDFIPESIRSMLDMSGRKCLAVSKYVICRSEKNNTYL